jgi:hypothetical protein
MNDSQGQNAFDKENDAAELDQLYRKKYGGLLRLSEQDAADIERLERKKFNIVVNTMITPSRDDSQNSQTSTSSSMTTSSSGGSSSTDNSGLSKASRCLARILSDNRTHKNNFAEVRISDVEKEIFAMEKEFHAAAEFHAPFLNLMK